MLRVKLPELPLGASFVPKSQLRLILPAPGSSLTKTYHGKTIEVKVLENGFKYEGKVFKSIPCVAVEETIGKGPNNP